MITGMADMTADRKALLDKLQDAEARRVEKENLRRSQEWQKLQNQPQRSGQQKEGITEKDIPPEELAKYAPITARPVTVPDQTIQELAEQRTLAAYEFFISDLGVGKDRIQKQTGNAEQPADSANRVDVMLQPLVSSGTPPTVPALRPDANHDQ